MATEEQGSGHSEVRDMLSASVGDGLVILACLCGWQSKAAVPSKVENEAIAHVVNARHRHEARRSH